MTNYERICADKAFCAWLLASAAGCGSRRTSEWEKWLDQEQVELTDELEHKEDL